MEIQPSVFCNETQIDVLRQVFTLTALLGYKEEVFPSRYACSVFLNEEELFNGLANYQIKKTKSLFALAICNAIKSNDNKRAIKLISRIASPVSKEVEKMNPNKIYYTFKRYVSVYELAIKTQNIEILEKMLTFPIPEKNKQAMFFFSIENKCINVIKYFISNGYNLNYELMRPFSEKINEVELLKTSLMVGVQTKNLEIVKLLVENGAVTNLPVNIVDNRIAHNCTIYPSLSPILISCLTKEWDIFEYLLDNFNIVHFNELIPVLCSHLKINLLKKLVHKKKIETNVNVDEQLVIEYKSLANAFRFTINNELARNFLLDNFNIDNEIRKKIICLLCETNDYDVLDQFLTKYPIKLDYLYFQDICEFYSEEMIECIIKHGQNVHNNDDEPSLLTRIAERNFIRIAQILLDRKIDINHQSYRGWTALMSAVTNGHSEMVQFLMENGADKTLKNDRRRDVVEMAKFRNRVEIIEILNKY